MVLMIRSRMILFVWLALICIPRGYAGISGDDADEYFEFLTRANHYSPLEHAGSHGTIGVGLGIGVASYDAPSSPDIIREHWRGGGENLDENKETPSRIYVSRIHVHKGLPYALDVGLGVGQNTGTSAALMSGYAQWTIYEGFAAPALAFRLGYNRLMALATTDASSFEAETLVSYGFKRFFTVYGGMGIGRHLIQVRTGSEFGTTMALYGETDGVVSKVLVRRSRSIGIQIQVLPPFMTVAFESASVGTGAQSYLAKLSIGI